jgi:glycosyltransferase involved in cell wall biosynthesis
MRIACIAASKVPSRTANSIQLMKVCQAFRELGHTIHLWLPGRTPKISWPDLAEHYGIGDRFSIHWLPAARQLRRYDFCMRAVGSAWRWGAELFYIWPLQAAALSSRLGLPTALEVHDRPQGRFGPWLFGQFLQGSGARRVLPTTEALRLWLENAYQTTLEPPFAILAPNGVDLTRYQNQPNPQEARALLGLDQGFTVGYTGHLYPGRGIDLLLELARRNPSMRFVWAGGEQAAVERWRQRLTAAGVSNVYMADFVSNERLPLIQAACEVLLMPYGRRISVSSGGDSADFASPMKVFEYLASGRAILSSDLPVLREVLNEQNAVLLPPENVDAWHEALQMISDDPARRKALAEQASQDVLRYTWLERAQRALQGLGAGNDS